jgi:hypothetical protein
MSWNRILSALLALLYIIIAYQGGGGESAFKVGLCLVLPLACIWFGDAMGGYTGPVGLYGISATSPGVIVCILGWLLLLLPIICWIL